MKEKKLFESVSVSKISKISAHSKSVRPTRQLQRQNTLISMNIIESVIKINKEKAISDDIHRKVILQKLAHSLIGRPLENDNKDSTSQCIKAAELKKTIFKNAPKFVKLDL